MELGSLKGDPLTASTVRSPRQRQETGEIDDAEDLPWVVVVVDKNCLATGPEGEVGLPGGDLSVEVNLLLRALGRSLTGKVLVADPNPRLQDAAAMVLAAKVRRRAASLGAQAGLRLSVGVDEDLLAV